MEPRADGGSLESNPIGRAAAAEIVALRERWHTKNHPFYLEFHDGRFGLEPMGRLMAQHYQHIRRVLPSQGFAYFRAPPEGRDFILDNITEEEGRSAGDTAGRHALDHQEIIIDFCEAAGVSRAEVLATEQLPAWRARSYFYINTAREEPIGVYFAMASTQEGQQPALNSERCLPALEKHHGFTTGSPEIAFFAEHVLADLDHSSRQLRLVERLITSEALKARALQVGEIMVRTRWACMTEAYRKYVRGETDPLPPGVEG